MVYIMKYPIVHIGIVAYENIIDLRKCLVSAHKQTYPNITITVFDNSFGNIVGELIRKEFPQVQYFKSAYNSGYGIGHNTIIRGLEHSKDDYYLTVNHDATLDSQYIEKMVECLQKRKTAWGMGKILNRPVNKDKNITIYSTGHAITKNGYFFNIGNGLLDNGTFDEKREVFGASGAAAVYSFRLIEAISTRGDFFDPAFFMYSEDTDVDWRARNAGFSCYYCPDAISYHRGGTRPEWVMPYAISHRYLSAIKNATLRQLLFSIIPMMVPHFIFRLLLTPKQGFQTMSLFITKFPSALRHRKMNRIVPQDAWIQWSRKQQTSQPVTVISRLTMFLGNIFR
jgi:GT2 family glycosyltransferase